MWRKKFLAKYDKQALIVDTALTKVTRVSCSTTLADDIARLVVNDMTVSASTTSKKRTVEAVYNFTITYPNNNHKHNYTAYYG